MILRLVLAGINFISRMIMIINVVALINTLLSVVLH